ncbi:hypothetical protein DM02DRAFT_51888 [Periconia macrospinosa]|uniref:Uncharacterized protein n=1 Tax=Periconia macrospinosa TaxID=97972 RepID=A0A2V1DJB4_9PLEO|nr:hypothetical protein DM02DRAFT_51888 [Periconia macrospinosa]
MRENRNQHAGAAPSHCFVLAVISRVNCLTLLQHEEGKRGIRKWGAENRLSHCVRTRPSMPVYLIILNIPTRFLSIFLSTRQSPKEKKMVPFIQRISNGTFDETTSPPTPQKNAHPENNTKCSRESNVTTTCMEWPEKKSIPPSQLFPLISYR